MRQFITLFLIIFTGLTAFGQYRISGTVTDQKNNPLAGANIVIKGTYVGTSTNYNGAFTLYNVPAGSITLITSYLGFENEETTIQVKGNLEGIAIKLSPTQFTTGEFVVVATRANEKTPIAYQDIDSAEIAANNTGLDVPFLLENAVSVVSTSDAGGAIGYTSMRIRGSDATRVAVSINGIPYNDPESQGTFWVNLPDIASSTNSIQIQRGVGTSTPGPAVFGANVNLNTTNIPQEAFGSYSGNFGSFNTQRHTLRIGTGLIADKFAFEGRISKIKSDGYIDRAASNLSSYYLSGAYYGKTGSLQFITFSGKEITYQAWYGVPERYLSTNRTYNPYDYPDQVDNYRQTHYQLHYKQDIGQYFRLNLSGFYVKGKGYFEEYKGTDYNKDIEGEREKLSDYGLPPIVIDSNTVITETNLVRRRWLDNDYTGLIFSLDFSKGRWEAILGGGYSHYDGDHFGEIIWAEFAGNTNIYHRYYESYGKKSDFNIFIKAYWQVAESVNIFADVQYRQVDYRTYGKDSDRTPIDISDKLKFLNPKAGVTWQISQDHKVYASAAFANHEPNRSDYIDAPQGVKPKHEQMIDYELGYMLRKKRFRFGANLYFMDYNDQLVLTGAVNDVGAPIRENVKKSYRAGIELDFSANIAKGLSLGLNTTLSRNKIASYTSFVDDWYNGGQKAIEMANTDIAFSPAVIGAATLAYKTPLFTRKTDKSDELSFALTGKYVGKQYLDNTQSEYRKLDPYFTTNFRLDYTLNGYFFKTININFTLRNLFNTMFVSNGWVYTFRYDDSSWDPVSGSVYTEKNPDGSYQMKGLFPQAGIHFLAGITIGF